MRVTKVIREYVEREVSKKFEPRLAAVGGDHQKRFHEFSEKAKELAGSFDEQVIALAAEYGLKKYDPAWTSIRIDYGQYRDQEAERESRKERETLTEQRKRAIEEILLNLELGETTKDELRAAIEAVKV